MFDADDERIYDYNDDGLVTTETDPLGQCTRSEWELGRLMARIDPLGRRTDYRYDDQGQMISVTDRSGRTIGFEYDGAQLLTAASLPNGGRIKLEYDHLHRLIARTESDGTKTAYRYGLGERRMTRTTHQLIRRCASRDSGRTMRRGSTTTWVL
ncbi:hypothetical protein WT01_19040 [Burkholderia cepacia]|nr:hypothetical protein WT01_19040 [Burkholderia cepacia]